LLEKIRILLKGQSYTFKHLRRKYNELADKASKNAAKKEDIE